VSSYTSNSNPHRRYVLRLLVLTVILVSGLFIYGVNLQPLFGDLTRIGSYAEKEFGWNKPQLEFQQPLSGIGRYEGYYDVVVLGDSFSTGRPSLHWQNYLVAAKGWSVVTLNINKIKLEQILENPIFRKKPPKILIFESVERELPRRLENEYFCDEITLLKQASKIARPLSVTESVQMRELKDLTTHVKRETAWRDIKLGYVRDYLWNNLLRTLLGDANTRVAKVELAKKAPFSSFNKHAMLAYKDDFRKKAWWDEMGAQEISCRIDKMRQQVEENGQTQFVFMVAPDKLTAYADFIQDNEARNISALPELSGYLSEVMPRIDLALISAIHEGEQDVYLPDDTHWGSSGYQIAAETLITFLENP